MALFVPFIVRRAVQEELGRSGSRVGYRRAHNTLQKRRRLYCHKYDDPGSSFTLRIGASNEDLNVAVKLYFDKVFKYVYIYMSFLDNNCEKSHVLKSFKTISSLKNQQMEHIVLEEIVLEEIK